MVFGAFRRGRNINEKKVISTMELINETVNETFSSTKNSTKLWQSSTQIMDFKCQDTREQIDKCNATFDPRACTEILQFSAIESDALQSMYADCNDRCNKLRCVFEDITQDSDSRAFSTSDLTADDQETVVNEIRENVSNILKQNKEALTGMVNNLIETGETAVTGALGSTSKMKTHLENNTAIDNYVKNSFTKKWLNETIINIRSTSVMVATDGTSFKKISQKSAQDVVSKSVMKTKIMKDLNNLSEIVAESVNEEKDTNIFSQMLDSLRGIFGDLWWLIIGIAVLVLCGFSAVLMFMMSDKGSQITMHAMNKAANAKKPF